MTQRGTTKPTRPSSSSPDSNHQRPTVCHQSAAKMAKASTTTKSNVTTTEKLSASPRARHEESKEALPTANFLERIADELIAELENDERFIYRRKTVTAAIDAARKELLPEMKPLVAILDAARDKALLEMKKEVKSARQWRQVLCELLDESFHIYRKALRDHRAKYSRCPTLRRLREHLRVSGCTYLACWDYLWKARRLHENKLRAWTEQREEAIIEAYLQLIKEILMGGKEDEKGNEPQAVDEEYVVERIRQEKLEHPELPIPEFLDE